MFERGMLMEHEPGIFVRSANENFLVGRKGLYEKPLEQRQFFPE